MARCLGSLKVWRGTFVLVLCWGDLQRKISSFNIWTGSELEIKTQCFHCNCMPRKWKEHDKLVMILSLSGKNDVPCVKICEWMSYKYCVRRSKSFFSPKCDILFTEVVNEPMPITSMIFLFPCSSLLFAIFLKLYNGKLFLTVIYVIIGLTL